MTPMETPGTKLAGPAMRLPVLVGIVIIGLFFGVFGVWAALAPLGSAAIAPGIVSVETNRKTIQHLEGGIVDRILVHEGERVKAGQVLVRLDETQARATLELLRGRSLATRALEARLLAERDDTDGIVFPAELLSGRGDPQVDETVDGQVSIFSARREALDSQTAILNQRIVQFGEEIKGLEGQVAAEKTQLSLISEEIEDVQGLYEKGLARRPRLLELQRQGAEIEGSLSGNRAAIARARQSIAEARLHISDLRTSRINEVVQQLREVQTELFDMAERMRAAEDVLGRIEIRTPLDGTIVGLRVHTAGGVIGPGEPLMDIVPSGDRLVIEAQVDPGDIDVVHAELAALVRLTAFSQRNLAPVKGKVISVSADRLVDQNTGQSYYLARIELLEDPADILESASLYPGMQAEVMIVTGERTMLDYLTRPITLSLNRAFREN